MNQFDKNMPGAKALERRLGRVRKKKSVYGIAVSLALTAVLTYILLGVVFGLAIVKGSSMEPELQSGDMVVFSRINTQYQRGDIVLLRVSSQDEDYIKRIVAVEGDEVDIDDETGELIVNGEKEEGSYIYTPTRSVDGGISFPITVPEDSVFVLGDNRTNSEDSRALGAISISAIEGKVLFTLRNDLIQTD